MHDTVFQCQPYAPATHASTVLADHHNEVPLLSQGTRTPTVHSVQVAVEEMRLNQGVKRSTDPVVPVTPEKEKQKHRRSDPAGGDRHD